MTTGSTLLHRLLAAKSWPSISLARTFFAVFWALLLALALYGLLGRLLTYQVIPRYQDSIVTWISARLNADLRIGNLETTWHYLVPYLQLKEVTVANPAGLTVVQIDSVKMSFGAVRALASLSPTPRELVISGLQILLSQREDGTIGLKGMPRGGQFNPNPFFDLLLQSKEVRILNGELILDSANPHLADAELQLRIDGKLTNYLSRWHQLRLRLSGVDAVDCPNSCVLEAQADFRGDPRNADFLHGEAQLGANTLVVDRWRHLWLHKAPFLKHLSLHDLSARVRVAAGRITKAFVKAREGRGITTSGVGLDAHITDLAMTLESTHANTWALHAEILAGMTNGTPFSVPEIDAFLLRDDPSAAQKFWIVTDDLDLPRLVDVLLATPILRLNDKNLLRQLRPQGRLQDLRMLLEKPPAGPWELALQAQLVDMSVDGHREIPSIHGVAGSLLLSQAGGDLMLKPDNPVTIGLPLDFAEPIRFESTKGMVHFRFLPQGAKVFSNNLAVSLAPGEVTGGFALDLTTPVQDRTLTLHMGIADSNMETLRKFVPLRINPGVRKWVLGALLGGNVNTGGVLYLHHFKGRANSVRSVLELVFTASDAVVRYDPSWPDLQDLDADVQVTRAGIFTKVREASLAQLPISAGTAFIDSKDSAWALVKGRSSSDLERMLQFIRTSPARDLVPQDMLGWQMQGMANVEAGLRIPLTANKSVQIRLDVDTEGADLHLPGPDLRFEQVTGTLVFDSRDGVNSGPMSANFMGGTVRGRFFSDWQGDKHDRISAEFEGDVQFPVLADWIGSPYLHVIEGSSAYRGLLHIGGDPNANDAITLELTSDLVGATIPLPAPFEKQASQSQQMAMAMALKQDDQIRMELQWAPDVNGLLLFSDGQLRRGRVQLGGDKVQELPHTDGVDVYGHLAQMDVSAWLDFLDVLEDLERRHDSGAAAGGSLINRIEVNSDVLSFKDFQGRKHQLVAQPLGQVNDDWIISVTGTEISGDFVIRGDPESISSAALDFLKLQSQDSPEGVVGQPLDPLGQIHFTDVIPMDISLKQMHLDDQPYGSDWSFKVRPEPDRIRIEDLRANLNGLHIGGPDADSESGATLTWFAAQVGRRSNFNGTISGENLGEALKAWQLPDEVQAARAHFSANLSWPGSPVMFELNNMEGAIGVELHDGQIVGLEKGSGILKFIKLLDPTSLPKRILLNFSDVASPGLAFSQLRSEIALDSGIVTITDPLVLTGPGSKLRMGGQINLLTGQLNGDLVVTLPISKNLPLYAAYAAIFTGPLTGVGIWLAQHLLRGPIKKLSSVRYGISGTLDEPELQFSSLFDDDVGSKDADDKDKRGASDAGTTDVHNGATGYAN